MQSRSPSVHPIAGHEFNLRMVRVDLPMPPDRQPQPLHTTIEIHDNGAVGGAPRIQQILASL